MKYQDWKTPPTGGLHRVAEWAYKIRQERGQDGSEFHPIETLDALLNYRNRGVRRELVQLLSPIAAISPRRAADELRALDKGFLKMGNHQIPMNKKQLDHLAKELLSNVERIILRYGYSERAVMGCGFICGINGIQPIDREKYELEPTLPSVPMSSMVAKTDKQDT